MINIGNYPFTAHVWITSFLSIEGQNTLLLELTTKLLTILTLKQEQVMYILEKQCLQKMPSSMISAILQEHDITFIVTSSMIETYNQTSQQ